MVPTPVDNIPRRGSVSASMGDMTTVDPPSRPRPRAFWADIRFLIGVLLVIVSIAGVWMVVAAARQTTTVFAATRTIVSGQSIGVGDLRAVEVALGSIEGAYVAADALPDAAVATRTIHAGELVPADSLGGADAARTTTVVVRSAADVPGSVIAGSTVEIWSAPLDVSGDRSAPRILVADATVVEVARDDNMMGRGSVAVELVIPRADVAAVLAAQSTDAVLSVVPANGAS